MGTYKVDICGGNTSKLPILKEAEKEELFKRIKAGDMEDRETYIQGNLRLVLSVIRRFSNHNENLDDLFQIGCIGLMKSVDNFDPTIGVKFSTYAVPMNVTCQTLNVKNNVYFFSCYYYFSYNCSSNILSIHIAHELPLFF